MNGGGTMHDGGFDVLAETQSVLSVGSLHFCLAGQAR